MHIANVKILDRSLLLKTAIETWPISVHNQAWRNVLSSSYWLWPDLLWSFWGFCQSSEGGPTINTTRCNKNSVWALHRHRRRGEFQKPSSGPVWTFAHAVLGAAHAPWQIVSKSKLRFYYRSVDEGLDQSPGLQITLTSSNQKLEDRRSSPAIKLGLLQVMQLLVKKKKKKNPKRKLCCSGR